MYLVLQLAESCKDPVSTVVAGVVAGVAYVIGKFLS